MRKIPAFSKGARASRPRQTSPRQINFLGVIPRESLYAVYRRFAILSQISARRCRPFFSA